MPITSGPTRAGSSRVRIATGTLRRDRWWLQPALTELGLLAFVAYSTWAAFQNADYYTGPYVSPFYSPCISASCPSGAQTFHATFAVPAAVSPALIVLIFPLGFRVSCYYYRKAYYRSFWLAPPACAVPEPHKRYTGETRFPLILQNVHRYFFLFGVLFASILTYNAVLAFDFGGHAGIGSRHACPGCQRDPDLGLHPRLPLLPAHHRRPAAGILPASGPLPLLDLGVGAQRQAHAMGVGQPDLGGPHRRLRPARRQRRHHRREVLLMAPAPAPGKSAAVRVPASPAAPAAPNRVRDLPAGRAIPCARAPGLFEPQGEAQ